jgi:hypothetical protein
VLAARRGAQEQASPGRAGGCSSRRLASGARGAEAQRARNGPAWAQEQAEQAGQARVKPARRHWSAQKLATVGPGGALVGARGGRQARAVAAHGRELERSAMEAARRFGSGEGRSEGW